jgi:hypothetical protein
MQPPLISSAGPQWFSPASQLGCSDLDELAISATSTAALSHGSANCGLGWRTIETVFSKWRQRLASLISSALFLGFLWVLFKQMIVVTWITIPWWGFILLLILFFVFIETLVSRTLGAKEPAKRAQESVQSGVKQASTAVSEAGQDSLDAVKARLEKFNKPKG